MRSGWREFEQKVFARTFKIGHGKNRKENYMMRYFPTDSFTILELQNPSYDVPGLYKIRWSPDCEALKLWKGWSGWQSMRKSAMPRKYMCEPNLRFQPQNHAPKLGYSFSRNNTSPFPFPHSVERAALTASSQEDMGIFQKRKCGQTMGRSAQYQAMPDRTFDNLKASKFRDGRTLCCSETSFVDGEALRLWYVRSGM